MYIKCNVGDYFLCTEKVLGTTMQFLFKVTQQESPCRFSGLILTEDAQLRHFSIPFFEGRDIKMEKADVDMVLKFETAVRKRVNQLIAEF